MTYSELNNLWNDQESRWAEWRDALLKQAHRLGQEVLSVIQPASEGWDDPNSHKQRRYVDVIALSGEAGRQLLPATLNESLTDDNELVFGLAITFERAANAFPKEALHVPLALRFREGHPEFAFYDTLTKSVESSPSWQPDISEFSLALLRRVEEHLRFDPFNGPRQKSSIGFI